jgi:hypothetical protein
LKDPDEQDGFPDLAPRFFSGCLAGSPVRTWNEHILILLISL